MYFLRYAFLSLLLLWVPACAQLPDYAKPQTIKIDGLPEGIHGGFTYRPLTPDDFQAASLPAHQSAHGEHINAQSAILIRITADSSFKITPWPLWGQMNYLGSINRLAFEAVMIPKHSWWNKKISTANTAYVLQHEQIHFALTELAARQLTRDARAWASNVLVVKQTTAEVYSEFARQIEEKIKAALEASKKRHLAFDNDASLYYNPKWQDWWYETVEEELKQTALKPRER